MHDRLEEMECVLDNLMKQRGLDHFEVYVSTDFPPALGAVKESASSRGLKRANVFLSRTRMMVGRALEWNPHIPIAQHYYAALENLFMHRRHSHVIILEVSKLSDCTAACQSPSQAQLTNNDVPDALPPRRVSTLMGWITRMKRI